jgi:hypothetical protein
MGATNIWTEGKRSITANVNGCAVEILKLTEGDHPFRVFVDGKPLGGIGVNQFVEQGYRSTLVSAKSDAVNHCNQRPKK